MQDTLARKLARTREQGAEWQPMLEELVEALRRIGVGKGAPAVGDTFPAFSIPDAAGRYRSLDGLLSGGPLVLSFFRGGWCPYCTHELRSWNEALPALREAGGNLAAVTPEVGGRAALLGRLLTGEAELLCDVDSGVALASGLAFYLGEPLLRRYKEIGLDLAEVYGTSSGFLPVPATFVLDAAGVVRYAFSDPDFRVRAEPDEVVAVVAALS